MPKLMIASAVIAGSVSAAAIGMRTNTPNVVEVTPVALETVVEQTAETAKPTVEVQEVVEEVVPVVEVIEPIVEIVEPKPEISRFKQFVIDFGFTSEDADCITDIVQQDFTQKTDEELHGIVDRFSPYGMSPCKFIEENLR